MIKTRPFGRLNDGRPAHLFEISKGEYTVGITEYGATIVSFCGPDKKGQKTDVVQGFDSIEPYLDKVGCMGATIGRFGNRIEGGKFTIGGEEYTLALNNGPNHIHGGLEGFNRKMWEYNILNGHSIEFSYVSCDGEEGYPGNLDVQVTYSLYNNGELKVDYYAVSDRDTVINLTNHTYFNLNGVEKESDINNHELWLDATAYCETDENCLANGNIMAVRNTPFDFTKGALVGDRLSTEFAPIKTAGGIDHNFCIGKAGEYKLFGSVYSQESGIEMLCYTDQPGVQIYTRNSRGEMSGKGGVKYGYRSAICLETQGYPNSTTYRHFPTPELKKGEIYRRKTVYKLGVKK